MRALYSAASGMKSQQLYIDTISNNLANVNTSGYKLQRIEFKDLLYEQLRPNDFSEGTGRPVNLEVGHGVTPSAIVRSFGQGSFEQTNNDLDVAITGEGFFVVRGENDKEFYTKNGAFKLSVDGENTKLVNADGRFLQGDGGDIDLGDNVKKVIFNKNGLISVTRGDVETPEEVDTMRIVRFPNAAGMESIGDNLYKATAASGEAVENTEGTNGTLTQGFLESSNVQVVDEMIKLITAQRAYEINSKTIQTADSMLELANNLKR